MSHENTELKLEQESLFLEKLVQDVSCQLVPRERMLVSILAMESEYGHDITPLLMGLARETRNPVVASLANTNVPNANSSLNRQQLMWYLLPTRLAMLLESIKPHEQGRRFFRLWLGHATDDRGNRLDRENGGFVRLGRGVSKFCIVLSVISFVFLFVVPEFQKMAAEFGVELDDSLGLFPVVHVLSVAVPFVLLLLFLLGIIGFVTAFFLPHGRWFLKVVRNFLRRWHPWNWRRVTFSAKNEKQMDLAYRLQGLGAGGDQQNMDWTAAVEGSALRSTAVRTVAELDDPETQAWLIRHSSLKKVKNRQQRWYWCLNVVFAMGQLFLIYVVFALAWFMFGFLINMIEGLSGI